MRIKRRGSKFYIVQGEKTEYPILGIMVAVILLYLAPFVSTWLSVASILICAYRMVRYNARVFAVDYCMLMPISALAKIDNGAPLLIYLCLLAGILYLIRGGFRVNACYLQLLVLLNYLFIRMQMNVNDFVLCFGQLFVLCTILPEQDTGSAERAIKAFCSSLIISSAYAFLLRNTYALRAMTGTVYGPMWGTSIIRFCGLFADPNYYATFLVVGIALLLKLKDSEKIRNFYFWFGTGCMAFFGVITYSKMFFLMLVLLIGVYVVWQYWNKKFFRGIFLTVIAFAAMVLVLTMEDSPFSIILQRFGNAKNLRELTTGRTYVVSMYLKEITSSFQYVLFGKGLAAETLYREPHNLYIEIVFYVGIVGLVLLLCFCAAMMNAMLRRGGRISKENIIAKYMVIMSVMGMYMSLHGLFTPILYSELFLAYLSVLITKKENAV